MASFATWPLPQTNYGSQKIMGKALIADMTRKGFVMDGRFACQR